MPMAVRLRWLRVLFPAGLLVLAGCTTPLRSAFEDLPPAQLDPAPPRPITTPLPPVADAGAQPQVTSAHWPAAVSAQPVGSQPPALQSLNDLIMGRQPPAAEPAAVLQPPTAEIVSPFPPAPVAATSPASLQHAAPPRTLPPAPQPVTPAAAPISIQLNFRRIIALQTLLDRGHFSCNCADGRIGSRTRAALRAWQGANGLPVTGEADAATLTKMGPLDGLMTTCTITAEDHVALVAIPKTWLGKSQIQRLGYETILETVAERGHAAQQAIRDLNPQVSVWPDPPAGTTLTIPDVKSSAPLPHAARIRIIIGQKLVRVFDGVGQPVAQFPCSIARDPQKREPCEISVAVVAPDPNYTFDPELFSEEPESKTIKTKLIIPPGPRNPVGSAWVGLSKTGYGLHGTPHPEDIGKTESHGCFRLANWNAIKLLHMVDIGTPVSVEE